MVSTRKQAGSPAPIDREARIDQEAPIDQGMRTTGPAMPLDVAEVFAAWPAAARRRLLAVRNLIFETAAGLDGVGPLAETLKWGEPAYLTEATRSGSTIRLGLLRPHDACAVLFNCRSTLVADCRARFPDAFLYEGDRAIVLPTSGPLPTGPLAGCLALALTYHRRGRKDRRPGGIA